MPQFRFAPPTALNDLIRIQGGLEQWHSYVDAMMQVAIDDLSAMALLTPGGQSARPQFFNPAEQTPDGRKFEVPILWNAFPRRLLMRFGRAKALVLADMLWPPDTPAAFDPLSPQYRQHMRDAISWVRPQDEYCEWRVERDPVTQRIQRLVFTVETPEYWHALHGGTLPTAMQTGGAGKGGFMFRGDPCLAAGLYSSLLGRPVAAADLADGHVYNAANRWNTTHGIVHLSRPNNLLRAAVALCVGGTVSSIGSDGKLITHPEAYCASRDLADANRNSDVAIASTVNALARSGAWLSLSNPTGLGIAEVDTSGWALPSGFPPAACLHIVRGAPGCAQRLVIEVPRQCPDTLDRLTIAGEPLVFGGQIAECITVKTTVLCVLPEPRLPVAAVAASHRGNVLAANSHVLVTSELQGTLLPGHLPAFVPPARTDCCVQRRAYRSGCGASESSMIKEPVLELDDIQGIAVPGFFKPHQALLFLNIGGAPSVRSAMFGQLLKLLDDKRVTDARQALDDRRAHRKDPQRRAAPLLALALTESGLNKLCQDLSTTVPSVAFQAGMGARATLLGDPDPETWTIPRHKQDQIDVMLVIAGDCGPSVCDMAKHLQALLVGDRDHLLGGVTQYGNARPGMARGHEHFGFADGISQPGIRGRSSDSDSAEAFITPRALPACDPEHDLFGQPGQDLVWPGEFVLGYPASSPDPRIPGPVRPVPEWMRNGSFLVFRRLRQHVPAFKSAMASEAARLRELPGFCTMTDKRLAAMLVGRWPSGAPVSRSPMQDSPASAKASLLNNDFRYDDDTPVRSCLSGDLAGHPAAKADPIGLVCPVAAHIRKVNLRDQASDIGGASGTQTRRLLRVGIPYGPEIPELGDKDPDVDRGLLFLSIQASIEEQFEFLQARWMNSATRPRGLGGHDMVLGQPTDGIRRCTVFGDGMQQEEVVFKDPFVTMTGGAYLFVPGLKTLRELLDQAVQAQSIR